MTPEIDLSFLQECLREAGQMALPQRGQRIAELKADRTPVTVVDQQVEAFLIQKIQSRYPEHNVLSEESGSAPGSLFQKDNQPQNGAVTWIIDPIDGTRAFAGGLPIWGVSIGIFEDGKPQAGGFYLPVTGEMFWGTCQQGYYNNLALPKLNGVDLKNPLVFLAVPSNFHLHFKVSYPRVRTMGSTAAHLAYVAAGMAVGALTRQVSLWDLAGLLPALEAGGITLSYLSGADFHVAELLDGKPIREPLLVAHPAVIEDLRQTIQAFG